MSTTDIVPSATYTINDSTAGDTIFVADGPVVSGFQTTQVTLANGTSTDIFANKTAVTIDGQNNGDSVVLDNPDPAMGMTSLTVTNLGAGSTINGSSPSANIPDIAVATLILQAVGIGTNRALQTQANLLSASVSGPGGNINITNGVATPVTLNTAGLLSASGAIALTNNGTINVLNNNQTISIASGSGNLTVKALGAAADLNTGGQTVGPAILGSGSSPVDVEAGRDMNLGNIAGFGDVRSITGSITLKAGRNITIANNTFVDVFTGSGGISATAGGNITMLSTTLNEIFTNTGGPIALTTGVGGTLTVDSLFATPVSSPGGNIMLSADAMVINKGVNAGTGNVLLRSVTAGEAITLGALAGGLQLTNAALNEVTAKNLTIGNATAGSVAVAGAIAPAHVTNLTINTSGNFIAGAASTINIGAGVLTIGFSENNLGAIADLSGATITAGMVVVNGGAGNDIFITGAGSETINGGGGIDTVNFSGTRAQYTVSPEGQLVLVTKGGVTDTLSGISFLHFSDQTIPVPPPPATPAGTTADMILQETSGANTGQLEVYDLGSNSILAGYALGGIGLNWQTLGLGSFASNPNEADMLMRDANTGNIDFFDIASSQIVGAGLLGTLGAAWQPLGFGDFSGNANETDMLMRNINTGAIDYFDIQHNQIVSAGVVGGIGVNWQVLGFGDVSGVPGESDMIMRDTNTGAIDYFDIQHNQIVSSGALGGIGTDWHNQGVGSPLVLGSPLV